MARSTCASSASRGISLVELLVGLAVGLLVLVAASAFALRQLREVHRLQQQTQVQQALRAAADLVLRDLRRAAHWREAAAGLPGPAGEPAAANPHATLQADASGVTFGHADAPQAGFRLREQTVQMLMGGAGWQALTDPAAVRVLRFELDIRSTPIALPCARACESGDTACPPVQHRREAHLLLVGQSTQDAAVQRSLAGRTALRNDLVTGHCPA
jgi:type IV pilus assembly protein PilW